MSIEKKLRTTKNFVIIDHYRSGVLVDHEYLKPDEFAERVNAFDYAYKNVRHVGHLNDGTPIFVDGDGDTNFFLTMDKLAKTYELALTHIKNS